MNNVIPLRPHKQVNEALDVIAKLQFTLRQINGDKLSDRLLKATAEDLTKELHDLLYDYVETKEGR